MIGALSVGTKAAKYGYKAYGLPGAVLAGGAGAAGAVAAKKAASSLVNDEGVGDEETSIDVVRAEAADRRSDQGDEPIDEA